MYRIAICSSDEPCLDKLNKLIRDLAHIKKHKQKYTHDLNYDSTSLYISVSSFEES